MLHTLSQLPGDAGRDVELIDWKKMVKFLKPNRSEEQIRRLFYPSVPSSSLASQLAIVDHTTKRRPRFLSEVNDQAYYEIYQCIAANRQLRFPDIHCIMNMTRDDGKVLFQVMTHIIAWLNPNPTKIRNQRDNNKPPLRADLEPVLGTCSRNQHIQPAEGRLNAFTWDSNHLLPVPRAASILLQHEVLDFTWAHLADFKDRTISLYLNQFPEGVGHCHRYTERFSHKAWEGLLAIVRRWVGEDFHSDWMQSSCSKDRSQAPDQASDYSSSPPIAQELANSLCDIVKKNSELGRDSVLLEKLKSRAFGAALAELFNQQQGNIDQFRKTWGRSGMITDSNVARVVCDNDEIDDPIGTTTSDRPVSPQDGNAIPLQPGAQDSCEQEQETGDCGERINNSPLGASFHDQTPSSPDEGTWSEIAVLIESSEVKATATNQNEREKPY